MMVIVISKQIHITSALVLVEPFSLQVLSFKKLGVENVEAICCFGEAIAYLDYNISSGPFFEF